MKWIATECAWFSAFLLKPLLRPTTRIEPRLPGWTPTLSLDLLDRQKGSAGWILPTARNMPPFAATLSACMSSAYPKAEVRTMPDAKQYRLGLNQPAASPTARRAIEMAAAIDRETGGEFRLEVFPESRLGSDPQMFADLRAGALEFFMAGATLGEVAPTSALPLLPFAFKESKAVFAALDGGFGDRIRSELAQNGLHAFRHCWQNGFHHLTTSVRPIRTADDLAGL